MLGLSCTFLACVFDRLGWTLYSKPCHGPLVGLCWVTWWLCWAYVEQKDAAIWAYVQPISTQT